MTEAIYDAGFNSSGRFYATTDQVLGMTPTTYRAGGADTEIRFAVGECSLGAILVAASGKGVCAILLGDDPESWCATCRTVSRRRMLVGGDDGFEELVAKVVGFVEAPAIGLDLPLDVRGTAFQQRVWQALRDIPAGKTVSYAEIARTDRVAQGGARGRAGLRRQPHRGRDSRATGWCAHDGDSPAIAGASSASARLLAAERAA